jgi:hypothetical protein
MALYSSTSVPAYKLQTAMGRTSFALQISQISYTLLLPPYRTFPAHYNQSAHRVLSLSLSVTQK